jgi:hypothetical protein
MYTKPSLFFAEKEKFIDLMSDFVNLGGLALAANSDALRTCGSGRVVAVSGRRQQDYCTFVACHGLRRQLARTAA